MAELSTIERMLLEFFAAFGGPNWRHGSEHLKNRYLRELEQFGDDQVKHALRWCEKHCERMPKPHEIVARIPGRNTESTEGVVDLAEAFVWTVDGYHAGNVQAVQPAERQRIAAMVEASPWEAELDEHKNVLARHVSQAQQELIQTLREAP